MRFKEKTVIITGATRRLAEGRRHAFRASGEASFISGATVDVSGAMVTA